MPTLNWRSRLPRDFKRMHQSPLLEGASGTPVGNNLKHWEALICGPPSSRAESGTFKVTLDFTEDYPNSPPLVRTVSPMFHPNPNQHPEWVLESVPECVGDPDLHSKLAGRTHPGMPLKRPRGSTLSREPQRVQEEGDLYRGTELGLLGSICH